MSSQAIAAALATQLNTVDLPTQWENAPFTPTAGEVYLAEALIPATTLSVGVSDTSANNYGGIYQVSVYTPLGTTKGAGLAAVQSVLDAFTKGLRLTYDGVTVTILNASQAPALIIGDRWVIPISIEYRAFV